MSIRAIGTFIYRAALSLPGLGPVAAPGAAWATSPTATITAGDISWRLEAPAATGRFVTGDPYVVGPTVVVAVTPTPGPGRSGSMVDPRVASRQGYDDRVAGYDPAAAVAFPVALAPGSVLVSTASHDTDRAHDDVLTCLPPGDQSLSRLRAAAVLVCLAEPPPADAFRPPYCRPGGRLHTVAQLRLDALPRLGPPPAGADEMARLCRAFERPWIDHLVPLYRGRWMHPSDNMPDQREAMARAVLRATALLCQDRPLAAKGPLLYGLVQWGIDAWGLVDAGAIAPPGDDAAETAFAWPIALAGHLLGDWEMLAWSQGRRGPVADLLERGDGHGRLPH